MAAHPPPYSLYPWVPFDRIGIIYSGNSAPRTLEIQPPQHCQSLSDFNGHDQLMNRDVVVYLTHLQKEHCAVMARRLWIPSFPQRCFARLCFPPPWHLPPGSSVNAGAILSTFIPHENSHLFSQKGKETDNRDSGNHLTCSTKISHLVRKPQR